MLFTESEANCTYIFVCLKKKLYDDYSGLELLVSIRITPIKDLFY